MPTGTYNILSFVIFCPFTFHYEKMLMGTRFADGCLHVCKMAVKLPGLAFVDDVVLMSDTVDAAQRQFHRSERASAQVGLRIKPAENWGYVRRRWSNHTNMSTIRWSAAHVHRVLLQSIRSSTPTKYGMGGVPKIRHSMDLFSKWSPEDQTIYRVHWVCAL